VFYSTNVQGVVGEIITSISSNLTAGNFQQHRVAIAGNGAGPILPLTTSLGASRRTSPSCRSYYGRRHNAPHALIRTLCASYADLAGVTGGSCNQKATPTGILAFAMIHFLRPALRAFIYIL
jgi:hypothetical protein